MTVTATKKFITCQNPLTSWGLHDAICPIDYFVFTLGHCIKPALHIVVKIEEHACDHVLKRVLKLLTYRLQIFLVKKDNLRSLQLCEDQSIP